MTKTYKDLIGAVEQNDIDSVKVIISTVNPKDRSGKALRVAAKMGHTEIVTLLLPLTHKSDYSDALYEAARKGHVDIVKLLLPLSNPKAQDSLALRTAADAGHLSIVKLLLPVSDPEAKSSEALLRAVYGAHLDIIKLLLPVSGQKTKDQALKVSLWKGHFDTFELLFSARPAVAELGFCLSEAVAGGNLDIVEFLLPVLRPEENDFEALVEAATLGYAPIVKLLLPYGYPEDSRDLLSAAVNDHLSVIDILCPRSNTPEIILKAEQEYSSREGGGVSYLKKIWEAETTKRFLNENIQSDNTHSSPSKKM